MEKFKIGEIVELNSGSPKMTVRSISNGHVLCEYFEGSNILTGRFHEDQLFGKTKNSISLFWMEICDKFIHKNPIVFKREIQIVLGGWYTRYLTEFKPEFDTTKGEIQVKVPTGKYTIPLDNGIVLVFHIVDYEIFQILKLSDSVRLLHNCKNIIVEESGPFPDISSNLFT